MYFQNDDILSNLFSFGDLKIFLNRKMYTSHVEFIQKIDSTYVPRTKFPLNRTILDSKSNMYVQLDININICEIIIPSNHIEFKKNMFNHVINFMIESIKSFCDFRLANEVGYKILLYIPTKSPASQINWWLDTVSNKISFKQENGVVGKTVLGTNLSEQYVRYTLHIFFNEQYVLVKNSQSYNGNNTNDFVYNGNTNDFGNNRNTNDFGNNGNNTNDFGNNGNNTNDFVYNGNNTKNTNDFAYNGNNTKNTNDFVYNGNTKNTNDFVNDFGNNNNNTNDFGNNNNNTNDFGNGNNNINDFGNGNNNINDYGNGNNNINDFANDFGIGNNKTGFVFKFDANNWNNKGFNN